MLTISPIKSPTNYSQPNKSLFYSAMLLPFIGLSLAMSTMPGITAALFPVFILALYLHFQRPPQSRVLGMLLWLFTLLCGFFIALYRPDNFSYPLLWRSDQLYEGGAFFSLFVNVSKALGGYLIIIAWLFSTARREMVAMPLGRSFSIAFWGCLAALLIANQGFNLAWRPKLSEGIVYFAIVNLGVTVMAEEAFFRLLIQAYLQKLWRGRSVLYFSCGITTLLFAVAHAPASLEFWLLYLVVGGIYSLVFALTQRFSAVVVTHFSVNLLHFIFFEYPLS